MPFFIRRGSSRSWRMWSLAGALAALAPGGALHAQTGAYTLLGDARSVQQVPGGALLRAEHGSVLVESVAGVGVRVRVRFGDSLDTRFPTPHSLATGDVPPALGAATVREAGDTVVIGAALGLEVRALRRPLRIVVRDAAGHELLHESFGAATYDGRLVHYVEDPPGTRYFALGEQPTGLARNGGAFPFWNTDRFAYHPGETPIYSTMPFYLGVTDGVAHGVLYDNPFRGEMDFAGRLRGSIGYIADGGIDGGELRYYVVPGPGLDSVLARFSRLTGRMALPPRWALGYQQSRYSYAPDSMVMNVATAFRKRDIPADVLYLDIGYMNGYRVFTWDPVGFAHPKQLLDSLRTMGFKVVTIVDPGVKVDSAFGVYQRGLARHAYVTTPDGEPALGKVWPGTAVFPDFSRAAVRAWWGDEQKALLDTGVAGIWNDMNEPSSFTGGTLSALAQFHGDSGPATHLEMHNQYGTLMARASFEGLRRARPDARPFVITRAAYIGVQRYSSVWTGDNRSTWEHLRISIPMVLSLGLSGEPFAGPDIGGFAGTPDGELYARWLQSAVLLPFFRTHSTINVPRREPWSYGAEYERANRATIRLRYRLIPVLYTAFRQHVRDGSPVVRPIFWSDLGDTTALGVDDEYLLGDHLLAAPVVDSAANTREVYLPEGRWYRLGSDSAYDGGRHVTVSAPGALNDGGDSTGLAGLPIFARAGAVIPMRPVMSYIGERPVDTLALHVWPAASGRVKSELYEDAGDGYAYEHGEYRLTTLTTSGGQGKLELALAREGKYAGARAFSVVVHAISRPRSVRADGHGVRVRWDAARRTATFVVPSGVRRIVVTS
ncbi:MAG TPA: TIM-barrel domain-containing protein [Gemmatimonadaceae bacterium]